MNFDSLNSDFSKYLNTKLSKKDKSKKKITNNSIFLYVKEFKKYIKDKTGKDTEDFSADLDSLLNLDFKDIENDEFSKDNDDAENDNNEYDNDDLINNILKSFFEDKKALKTLDENESGELDDSEIKSFLENISPKEKEVNLNEILDTIKSVYDGTYDKNSKDLKDSDKENGNISKGAGGGGSSASYGTGGSGYSSGGVSSGSSLNTASTNAPQTNGSIESMSIDELKQEKTSKENELSEARENLNAVNSGENQAVQSAQQEVELAQEEYEKLLENDDKVSQELKEQREDNLKQITEKEKTISELDTNINEKDAQINELQTQITADESTLQAYKSTLSQLKAFQSDDEEKMSEAESKIADTESKISSLEEKIAQNKSKKDETEKEKDELKNKKEEEQETLEKLKEEQSKIEEEISKNCGEETKMAQEKYQEAQENLQNVKTEETQTAQSAIETLQAELDGINQQINELEAQNIEKENTVSEYNFDFKLELSDGQKSDLELFKQNWEANKDKYLKVENLSGMPAELVAAIHWRESSGNFNTYLHNGQPLGTPTTMVPQGVLFYDWTEAAVSAVENYGGGVESVEKGNLDTYYAYAEQYNGTGYRSHGINSPYVWAGTDKYTTGKYVQDGVFDPNYKDQQLGVAVMLEAILA